MIAQGNDLIRILGLALVLLAIGDALGDDTMNIRVYNDTLGRNRRDYLRRERDAPRTGTRAADHRWIRMDSRLDYTGL